jgi:pyruvate, water dikinase
MSAGQNMRMIVRKFALVGSVVLAALSSCSKKDAPISEDNDRAWECFLDEANSGEAGAGGAGIDSSDYLKEIGCENDFATLASVPLDASIPGARSLKFVVDLENDNELYFQDSKKYQIHFEFASEHLSVSQGFSPVGSLGEFNEEQYTSTYRRFVLGAVTHYEGPDIWAFELSPYDTASAEMIELAFGKVTQHSFFGKKLKFHPTSETIGAVAATLPSSVPVVTTDELFEGIDYQALNVAESYGRLRFLTADDLETQFVTFRDIVVLDRVPNDISVTLGIVTSEFQTPLAHINVLSQNRGTPNMAFHGAYDLAQFRDFEDKWVRLEVGPFDYELEEVTQEEADAWWEEHKPGEVQVPGANTDITALIDCEDMLTEFDPKDGPTVVAAVKEATRAFGGKAAHYAALTHIEGLPVPDAFGIPIYYYFQFMEENGFNTRVEELLSNSEFAGDPQVRDDALATLRADIQAAPVNAEFEALLLEKIAADYPVEQQRLRFRSSTNAEDLDGFTGAGLYTSKSGDPNDPKDSVLDAIREVWSSVWYFRAFEERSYRSIDHLAVGMALLAHPSFPEEEANGVALTDNPFDKSGLEPAFYVNVQKGGESVVLPPAGITTDEFLYYYGQQGQPTTYLSHSNLTTQGEDVLTRRQVHELGAALDLIRKFFAPAYGPAFGSTGWWAMDVEFKFDAPVGEEPQLFIKQARPFGNR